MQLECVRYSRHNDWIEDQRFSSLQKIIFGLSHQPLEAALEENPQAVRVTDAHNRTALDWATARAQLNHMKLLLEYNSDINTMDVNGRTTILHAVDSHNEEAVRILLEAGAEPNPTVPEGLFRSSPLKAASFGGLTEIVKLLLAFGAKVDAYNPEGQTALHAAIMMQKVECASVLLESGASLGDVAGNGRTPFVVAIEQNSHAVLELLVDRRYEHATAAHTNGPQVLTVVAEHADAETMSIIASSLPLKLALCTGADSEATCLEILRQRLDYEEHLYQAFEKLLVSM